VLFLTDNGCQTIVLAEHTGLEPKSA